MSASESLRLEVAHSVVHVHDLDRMIGFYRDTLGFEVTDRGPLGPNEIVFLSQAANHHHQVAFVDDRDEPTTSNNIHHTAYRSAGTLDDLKALLKRLESNADVSGIMPLTHGNAWSIYFNDPEHNGVEVFIDTPWHVAQPQARPFDLTKSNDAIVAETRDTFADEPGFGDIDAFYQERADHLAKRHSG